MDTSLTLFFNQMGQPWLDPIVMVLTKPLTWTPFYALLLLVLIMRLRSTELSMGERFKAIILILIGAALCILVADQVASHLCKPLFQRLRPTHEPSLDGIVRIVMGYHGGLYSFFSSHAANTCALAVYLSLIIRRRPITALLILYVAINCWTRLYLGAHYVSDILVGLIFGALVGYLIARLVSRNKHVSTFISAPHNC